MIEQETDRYTIFVKLHDANVPSVVEENFKSAKAIDKVKVEPYYGKLKLNAFKTKNDVIKSALITAIVNCRCDLEGVSRIPNELKLSEEYYEKSIDELVVDLDILEDFLGK